MNKNKNYDNDSLSTLGDKNAVRLRPSVIFGSDGLDGSQHTVIEIVANSRDEAIEGYGNIIEVTRFKDRSIQVIDKGRGIPLEKNKKEGKYNWEIVFTILYGGGKYDNNDGGNYEFSTGLNGLGTAATQFASEYMDVTVFRDEYKYELRFEKGDNVTLKTHKKGYIRTKSNNESTGSIIKWRPDLDVFNDIDIPLEFFKDYLKKQAITNKGITFMLYDEESDTTFTYYYEKGIVDYVKECTNNKNFTDVVYVTSEGKGKDRKDKPEYKVKFEIAFCFNNELNITEYFHNGSFLEHGGAPDKAIKSAFVSEIDSYLKKNNYYTKNEKKISFNDIEDSLMIVVNSLSTLTSFENQTKKAITNKFIQEYITNSLKHELEVYFIENKSDADIISKQVLVNKRSREKAEKTRLNVRKELFKDINGINNSVEKFVDCESEDPNKTELWLPEGDSALGSLKQARDGNFQALMPVKGKIRNCLKSDYNKIFKDQVIKDVLTVIGCGVEIRSKHNKDFTTFDIERLRWNKIIICTDADVDGFQIRCLVLTMFYVLAPTLIEKGYVYIAETPLFEITDSKGKSHFAYSDAEKNKMVSKLKGNYIIQRSKGLGENDPDMMWETTMNPESRRLIQMSMGSIEKMQEAFDVFMGDDLTGRKKYIEDNGHKYIDLTEVC